jgi:hypothetical protein
MAKSTRRFKKIKKNTTNKRGGKSGESKMNTEQKSERQGIFDMIGSKIGSVASSAATKVGDLGLKFVGLERINKSDDEEKVDEGIGKINESIEKIGEATADFVSDVANVADKTGSAIIKNVNEVLESDAVKETTAEAAKNTAEIVQENLEVFNDALNNPEVKAEVKEAIDHAGEVGSLVVEAAEKPIEKAVDIASNSAAKATAAASAGFIKVSTDMAAAIPGVGAVIEVGKILNDGSKAASAIVEAGTEAVEVASDAFVETKKKVEEGLKVLEEKKNLAHEISSRTNKSIKEFENVIKTQDGGRKTRRRLLKHRAKSKRVRFAM